jgi:hypothetical protein
MLSIPDLFDKLAYFFFYFLNKIDLTLFVFCRSYKNKIDIKQL